MSIQIMSSGHSTLTQTIPPVELISSQSKKETGFNDLLTPEQKNMVRQSADDKISEQVENVKGNYQTAKDIDLMRSYYQHQQKLFDIYTQNNSESNTNTTEESSAVSKLTKTYEELYHIHHNIKEGVIQLPNINIDNDNSRPLSTDAHTNSTNTNDTLDNVSGNIPANNISTALSNKQLDSYNSLMMPSTSNYIHMSA